MHCCIIHRCCAQKWVINRHATCSHLLQQLSVKHENCKFVSRCTSRDVTQTVKNLVIFKQKQEVQSRIGTVSRQIHAWQSQFRTVHWTRFVCSHFFLNLGHLKSQTKLAFELGRSKNQCTWRKAQRGLDRVVKDALA